MTYPTSAERVDLGDRHRITIGETVRDAITWGGKLSKGQSITFELREVGHARILAGNVFADRIQAAEDAGDSDLSRRLPLILIPAKMEDSYRVPLHQLVVDRVLGPSAPSPLSVVIWGSGECIDIWSNARWAEAADATLGDASQYLSA